VAVTANGVPARSIDTETRVEAETECATFSADDLAPPASGGCAERGAIADGRAMRCSA